MSNKQEDVVVSERRVAVDLLVDPLIPHLLLYLSYGIWRRNMFREEHVFVLFFSASLHPTGTQREKKTLLENRTRTRGRSRKFR